MRNWIRCLILRWAERQIRPLPFRLESTMGLRILMRRLSLGMSQWRYAMKLGVHVSDLAAWERGEVPSITMSYVRAAGLVQGFGFPCDDDPRTALDMAESEEARDAANEART